MHDEYFCTIEQHFQAKRGTQNFLLSPGDWALLEQWKNAGIPLASALRGIDKAFQKHRDTRSRDSINSLKFCSQHIVNDWVKNRVRA